MLRPYGEVHVSHKTSAPYDRWNLEELASKCYLTLTERVSFERADYPGYNNKRGDGARCDEAFLLGECSTFKFRVNSRKEKTASEANAFYTCGQSLMNITGTQHNIPLGQTLEERQFGGSISFDGNDHLIRYPRMSNTSSMQLMYGTPHENTRLFSRSNHSLSVGYQPSDHTTALPVIPGGGHGNLRHSEGNHYSLSARYQGVTNALQVMRHFNHADTINISAEWEGRDYDFLSRDFN
ncbi:heavy metal-associated isoprenylated plant protein 41 isoform X2 [Cinnamomum micranthum f. kanehirae]|uniref:Heavy metal-associated isoprenylated plant protein 41 isoform X2 n=1 Tax=Cinnamomum micranthum f. kanehirae TaxID=337451 RepID=A0A3S3M4N0_9MAGN|nr:heavy metal-associated isoprenylated plant protein 41 isoform X2 [Cinnamomum micranthum f. kanehirae]